uniref:Zinc finger protein Pegasus n=2 Tax=Denticeps clupeoides TaxID=299321 RepID=A0AAY4A8V7_9TELE
MGEKHPEPLDFVKDFQEYLTQQTQHVNMISGSVGVERDTAAHSQSERDGQEQPSVESSLADSAAMLVGGFERTYDGKLKCRYCNYASKGTSRIIEHIRIHTGEKPHRCHLCPFASAYERHLEAHMRSHTGEKPYKCELCSFRCSDRSNLSHHRRRRHKLLPMKAACSPISKKKILSVLQKKSTSLAYGRRLLVNFSPPSMVVQKPDYLSDFAHELPHLQAAEEYESLAKMEGGHELMAEEMNPLTHLSTLAGQLASLPPDCPVPCSPDDLSCRDEKPLFTPRPPAVPAAVSSGDLVNLPASPSNSEPRAFRHQTFSPVPGGPGPSSEHSIRTSTPSITNSQPSTPVPQLLHNCPHCDTYFADNILYTIHMGCHGYKNPFQCNICGCKCRDKYDFACHFARGQHKQ